MANEKKISCICITKNRPLLLREAIKCFLEQDYPNKELLILAEERDEGMSEIRGENVTFLQIPHAAMSLGELRNYAIEYASGEYIAQWDDDDWYHPQRLARQLEEINGLQGTLLHRVTVYDKIGDRKYISPYYLWEGTILINKNCLRKYPYPPWKRGEDTPVIEALYRDGHLKVFDMPELYTYIYHGGNTWDLRHFESIFERSTKL